MNWLNPKMQIKLQLILGSILISSTLVFLSAQGLFMTWENLIVDALFVQQTPPKQIVILGIDESSLQHFGAFPWTWDVWADVITEVDKLNARVIGFDVTFFEAREGKDDLVAAINKSDMDVVLAAKLIDGEYLTPLAELLSLPGVSAGYANFTEESDGKVRHAKLFTQQGDVIYHSLAYQVLRQYFAVPAGTDPLQLGFTQLPAREVIINYFGKDSTFKRISLVDFLNNPKKYKGEIENAIVMVGGVVQDLKMGLDDNFATPSGSMAGVEIHANVQGTILHNSILLPLPSIYIALLMFALGGISAVMAYRLSGFLIPLFAVFALLVSYLFAALLFFDQGYVSDFLYIPLGIGMCWLLGFGLKYTRKRSENLELRRAFSQYVNDKLLSEIMTNKDALKLGGDRRPLTILFSDIRGFTSLSEQVDPEELVHILNSYLTEATNEIFMHNGIVDKYLGDAVMALWNTPFKDDFHTANALRAAVGMVEALSRFNNSLGVNFPELKIGIGVNTGDAVVGNMGSEKRFDYTAIGDAVNLASRLEGLTKYYGVEIIIGENTREELERTNLLSEFKLRKLDRVSVKGKSQAIDIYQLGIDLSEEVIKRYEQALEVYLRGDFALAAELFSKIEDSTSQLMAERCRELLKDSTDWQGYWQWDRK